MKYKVLLYIAFSSFFFYTSIQAQLPSGIIIKNQVYSNTSVADILKDLSNKYPIQLNYDTELVSAYKISYHFRNIKLLDGIQQMLKLTKGLTYYVDEVNTIHIIAKESDEFKGNKTTQDQAFDERYRGLPQRLNFTLSGKVIDKNTGESLPLAIISFDNGKKGTQTNVDGYFTLMQIPSDTITLIVSYIGFRNKAVYLSPQTPTNDFIIEIEPEAHLLDEVTISGQKAEVLQVNKEVSSLKITPRNLTKLPNVGERDPFRAFQLMPGVSASNESSSGLYVRGGTPDQTLVLYDGFTVYHVDHLFGFFSAFNYNAIKDIQLYKGGFDARYGGRISAVAEITGKQGNSRRFNAGADISLLSANAFLESPIGKNMTVLVAARRSWKGPLYNKIFQKFTTDSQTNQQQNGNGNIPFGGQGRRGGQFANLATQSQTASSYFYDLNAKLTWTPTKKDIFTLSLYNGTDNMDNSSQGNFGFGRQQAFNVTSTTNDISEWGNLGGSFKWSHRWNERLYVNSLISYSNYYTSRNNSRSLSFLSPNGDTRSQNIGILETNNLEDLTGKIDFEYKLNATQQLEFGGQFTQNRIRYDYTQNDTIAVLSRNDMGSTSTVYVQDQIKLLNNKLTIKPGGRLNFYGITQKIYIEPRFSAGYIFNEHIRFKMATGRYYQFAKQINREDLSQGNRNYWLLANSSGTLPVTKSDHLIVGGSYETKGYLLDVEFYLKNNTGITEYTLRFVPQLRRGLTPQETFFNGSETIRGVDILIQKKFGALNGWIGYTLAEAVRNIAAFSDRPYFSDQDIRHQFKLVATYRYKNIDFAFIQIYSTGRPYTSIVGAYSITLLDGSSRDYTMPSDKNANRLPAYHRMDASATYNTKWGSIGLSVFNLYNRQNTWYKRFQIVRDGTDSFLQTTNVNYLGITPNLIISWKLH